MLNTTLLTEQNDPMGMALSDYFYHHKNSKLKVLSSMFDEDEIPVSMLFRTEKDMEALEQKALNESRGKVLDVGAGSGCHSLVLQDRGLEVEAIDISPKAVEVMKARGVKHTFQRNLFQEGFVGEYDTILMLMNGAGIIAKTENFPAFFEKMRMLLSPGGQILMDSSDLSYLYEDEEGGYVIDIAGNYYGEVDFQMKYKNVLGPVFDWLYVDFDTLHFYATSHGFKAEKIAEGKHYDYLVRLTMSR